MCACSRSSQTASTGTSVFESKYEASIASPTASESGTNSARDTPTIRNDGTKTARIASIASRRGVIVSRAASKTAFIFGSPRARWTWMFSIATVASSTRMPMASARPPSVMIFTVCPVSHRPTSAASSANGMVSTTIKALRTSRRKSSTIRPVRIAPSAPSSASPRTALRT